MKVRTIITLEARRDIKEIGRFTFQNWGLEQKNKYLGLINKCIEKIARGEVKGIDCHEIRTNYRKQLVGRHFIYYKWTSSAEVQITRVLHERMDVDTNMPAQHNGIRAVTTNQT